VEATECYSSDEIGIHWDISLKFKPIYKSGRRAACLKAASCQKGLIPDRKQRSSCVKDSNRRILKDRRNQPTHGLSKFVLRGRRGNFRRKEDQGKGGYVDRYGPGLLCLLVLILGLNVLDALLTTMILENGGQEINPVVGSVIQLYGDRFWVWKFVIVSVPLILLCLHSKFRLVVPLLLGISAIYITVILYQVLLMIY